MTCYQELKDSAGSSDGINIRNLPEIIQTIFNNMTSFHFYEDLRRTGVLSSETSSLQLSTRDVLIFLLVYHAVLQSSFYSTGSRLHSCEWMYILTYSQLLLAAWNNFLKHYYKIYLRTSYILITITQREFDMSCIISNLISNWCG